MMLNKKTKEIDRMIKESLHSIPVSNLSIVITDKEKEVYAMEYGSRRKKYPIFALGSTSKAVTALGMLKLAEDQSISLDTPVRKYLPKMNFSREVTIKDLLNHTSGISTYETIENLKFSGKYGFFEYANTNYNLIGRIVEVITRDTFAKYIEKHIFKALKMEQSFALSNQTKSKIVKGYKSYFGFPLQCDTKVPNENSWIQAPSGYLCSSARDMGSFLRYMMTYSYEGKKLSQFIEKTGVFVKNSPAIEDLYSKSSGIYSAGWIKKNRNNKDILYHTGKLSDFSSFIAMIPNKDLSVSILCNYGDFLVGTKQIESIFENVTSILIGDDVKNNSNTNNYFISHAVINSLLFVFLFFCAIPFIRYYFYGAVTKLTTVNGVILFFVHILIPCFLLNIFSIVGISKQAIVDFAPDLFYVLILGAVMLIVSGVWKAAVLLL